MLNTDIQKAQRIISGSYSPLKNASFHDSSFIYKTSNEDIRSYQELLINKENIFSITASGDQILNSILLGSTNITACDISCFPNYFLALKIAAVMSLTLEEYIAFFIEGKNVFNDEVYDRIKRNLSSDNKKFWDSLFDFFEGDEIYNSMLFSHEVFNLGSVKSNNIFLEEDNYYKLRKKIEHSTINYITTDLANPSISFSDEYDLVNLSSIIYYGQLNNVDNYKKLLQRFNLSDNGQIISYLYSVDERFRRSFFEESFSFKQFPNKKEGIMIYQK